MTLKPTPIRRRFQRGSVVRGAFVATALVGALGLQLAGPRLQSGLAAMAGIEWVAPGAMPMMAPTPSPSPSMSSPCASPSAALPAHPCKVAEAAFAGTAPAI
jgi:hypothetical protein